jgi:lactate 2-monooxygenase
VIGICTQDGHGDLAAARAAAVTGVPMVASTLSEDPLENVAAEFGETPEPDIRPALGNGQS